MNNEQKAQLLPSASLVQNGLLAEAKFRPILFSTEMVKAILEGRKTMTRRIIKWPGLPEWADPDYGNRIENGWPTFRHVGFDKGEYKDELGIVKCPYGKIGDILWVRESMYQSAIGFAMFKAGGKVGEPLEENEYLDWETFSVTRKAIPSIHMSKTACRIFLEITDVRVELLQDISEEDAINEGIKWNKGKIQSGYGVGDSTAHIKAKECFQSLWQKINGQKSWEANPYVWVIEFEPVERPLGFC